MLFLMCCFFLLNNYFIHLNKQDIDLTPASVGFNPIHGVNATVRQHLNWHSPCDTYESYIIGNNTLFKNKCLKHFTARGLY